MTDYISRETALNFETKITVAPSEIQAISQGMSLYAEHIKAIPAADVAPVVRCRECKYCEEKSPSRFWCQNERWPGSRVPSIGYCDAGKRRDDA